MKEHKYSVRINWIGNNGEGTKTYKSYRRDHTITVEGKPEIPGSSDPSFRGDGSRYNPEELLVAALSTCHMLSYLHLCSINQITVAAYSDQAVGAMEEDQSGSGRFVRVVLKPKVTIGPGDDQGRAALLHEEAHHLCFIANSVNFPVEVEPEFSA